MKNYLSVNKLEIILLMEQYGPWSCEKIFSKNSVPSFAILQKGYFKLSAWLSIRFYYQAD